MKKKIHTLTALFLSCVMLFTSCVSDNSNTSNSTNSSTSTKDTMVFTTTDTQTTAFNTTTSTSSTTSTKAKTSASATTEKHMLILLSQKQKPIQQLRKVQNPLIIQAPQLMQAILQKLMEL